MKLKIALPILLLLSCGQGNNQTNNTQQTDNQRKINTQNINKDDWEATATSNEVVQEINIQNLYKAMEDKDEQEFLRQFPKDFNQFQSYFGWDTPNDAPHELYEHNVHYIEYLFYLLRTNNYSAYERNIITICENGQWEADGVNYFQHHVLAYIKENEKYYLINELDDETSKSVLFFLFDGPHPKLDTEFASHLSPSKKRILEELFEIGFYDDNENPDPIILDEEGNTVPYSFSNYLGSEHFFIRDIDVNKDGLLDKIVSAGPYQGDELLLFIHKDDEFQFALKSTNFSEDGGNQIVDIVAEKAGFYIKTAFPDRGLSEAYHHITYKNHAWILVNTVYKTQSNQEDAFIYSCDVKQGINLADTNIGEQLKWMPDEADRNRLCTKTKS